MIFDELNLKGAYLIHPERHVDPRGFFVRTYCKNAFEREGIHFTPVQCSSSYNKRRGTIRGLHFQQYPHAEAKLVRCVKGKIYDVFVDLRPDSRTYHQWRSVELSSSEGQMLFIPEGFAHGFQTLEDDVEVLYQISSEYQPDSAHGIRWDEKSLAISWPVSPPILSDRDIAYPDFEPLKRQVSE
jgi:dTDP-4-dehydrorhamnose 3,5-epimerase